MPTGSDPAASCSGNRAAVVVGEIDGVIRDRTRAMHAWLQVFEPQAVLTENIWGYLWGKLAYGAMLFATALTLDSMTEKLRRSAPLRRVRQAGTRGDGVAESAGRDPRRLQRVRSGRLRAGCAGDAGARASIAALAVFNSKTAKTHTGIYRDLAVRKRRTEVDPQIGVIGELGREAESETPAIRHLVALIHEIEDGKAPMAFETSRASSPPARRPTVHMRFDGQVALVTGAAQGIGQGIASALKDAGATVVASDMDGDRLTAFAQATAPETLVLDIADRAAAHRAVADLAARHGRLDILVNAAGGVRGQVGRPGRGGRGRRLARDLRGECRWAFWLSQAASVPMQARGSGRIVNIASGAACGQASPASRPIRRPSMPWLASPNIEPGSRADGHHLQRHRTRFVRSNPTTERQWQSYGPKGQARLVNSIHTRRLGTAQDIANAVLFLASAQAA